MRYFYFVLMFVVVSCTSAAPLPGNGPAKASKPVGDIRTQECVCTYEDEFESCSEGDVDGDCRCNGTDNCIGVPNCPQDNADSDAWGDACDELPNTPDPESVLTALDARLDALEGAGTGAAIIALQYDLAALDAALVEIRTKYPTHYHGLLGLAGDPVGSSGELSYSLPSDP
jgi:hypothetical protein